MNPKDSVPTQLLVEIESIENDILVLPKGGMRKILMVSGVNLDLKSEEEKTLILSLFQSFLNSLNFSLQCFVHSRRLNIEGYITKLSERARGETNELLKNQIGEYQTFIKSLVTDNAIMNKNYFVVVPFDPVDLGDVGRSVTKGIFKLFKKNAAPNPEETKGKEERFREHVEQLNQRVSEITEGLNQIELRAVPLNNEELIELFYNLYNPGTVEKKEMGIAKTEKGIGSSQ